MVNFSKLTIRKSKLPDEPFKPFSNFRDDQLIFKPRVIERGEKVNAEIKSQRKFEPWNTSTF